MSTPFLPTIWFVRPRVLRKALNALSWVLWMAALAPGAGLAAEASATTDKAESPHETEVVIRARRLNAAQLAIQPSLGASTFVMPKSLIDSLPGGENASISSLVLQTPGVVQDSFGQLHVRGDHNGVQYRLNGIILPEGLSSFGQVLSPRYADSVTVMDGALPSQYGLRTAAVINIKTRTGLEPGGEIGLYGGSHGRGDVSLTYGASDEANTGFGSMSYGVNQLGIESPYDAKTPLHDRTTQGLGFGYFERILNDHARLSLIVGGSDQRFQLPNIPGLFSNVDGAGFTVNGQSHFASDRMNALQHEQTAYAIASWLRAGERLTSQISVFARTSRLDYTPDNLAELAFNGIAQTAAKSDDAFGVQAEAKYDLTNTHILRFGAISQIDQTLSKTTSLVLPVDNSGVQTSDSPLSIIDNGQKHAATFSAYLQDEWLLSDKVTVNYGLRYDGLNAYRHESQVSPRLNMVYQPNNGLTLHAGYARYFTPPPLELIATTTLAKFDTTSAAQSGANDAAFAERDDYYDIGLLQKLAKGLTLGLDTYYRKASRLIDEGQFGAPIILTPFNYQDGIIRGAELSLSYSHGDFSTYANYALSSAIGRKIIAAQFNFAPDDLTYIQDHYIHLDHDQRETASAGVSTRLGPFKLSLDGLYGSGLRKAGAIPNGDVLKPYAQLNLSLAHKFSSTNGVLKGVELRLDIINLLDRSYEIRDGSGIGVGAPQWGPRRGVFVGLTRAI